MRDAPLAISLAPPGHAGIIIFRPELEQHRGILLLNLAETWTRIRFLAGFRSASFFVDPDHEIVAEYVQWNSADDISAAFHQPAFAEHLQVNATMAPRPVSAFGGATDLASADGGAGVELASPTWGMTILSCAPGHLTAVRAALIRAYRSAIGAALDAIAVNADGETGQIGVLVACRASSVPIPALEGVEATIVEHLPALRRYATVPAGHDPALALRYAMVPLSEHAA